MEVTFSLKRTLGTLLRVAIAGKYMTIISYRKTICYSQLGWRQPLGRRIRDPSQGSDKISDVSSRMQFWCEIR